MLLRGADHEDEDPDVLLRAPHRLARLLAGLLALPHPELERPLAGHRHPGRRCAPRPAPGPPRGLTTAGSVPVGGSWWPGSVLSWRRSTRHHGSCCSRPPPPLPPLIFLRAKALGCPPAASPPAQSQAAGSWPPLPAQDPLPLLVPDSFICHPLYVPAGRRRERGEPFPGRLPALSVGTRCRAAPRGRAASLWEIPSCPLSSHPPSPARPGARL